MISLVLVLLTQICLLNIMPVHRWADIEPTAILIILLVSLVHYGTVLKTRNVCVTRPLWIKTSAKVVKLCIFVALLLCFMFWLIITTVIDHD